MMGVDKQLPPIQQVAVVAELEAPEQIPQRPRAVMVALVQQTQSQEYQ